MLASELTALGFDDVHDETGGVRFAAGDRGGRRDQRGATGLLSAIERANRSLRTASRVLLPRVRGQVTDSRSLYALAQRVDWRGSLPPRLTIAVSAFTSDRALADSRHIALVVKDAIVDAQRGGGPVPQRGSGPQRGASARSNVDRRNPDVPIVVHIAGGVAEISLDTSGRPLHERGYRTRAGGAPLRETLAAGMILHAGWDCRRPLLDPFCGSGTIVIEAAMLAAQIDPGALGREYAWKRWPSQLLGGKGGGRDRLPLAAVRSAPSPEAHPLISASDIDETVIEIARENARRAGVDELIEFRVADARQIVAPAETGGGIIVCNPPYGKRLVDSESISEAEIGDLYEAFGEVLKASFTGWRAWLLTANREAAKRIRLRSSSKSKLFNGGIECRLLEYGLR